MKLNIAEPVCDTGAECSRCELKDQRQLQQQCFAYAPENFNGMMIIGEGPGRDEVVRGRPFVGRSGKLLRALLKAEHIDMDECYITNATLCKPPRTQKDGPFMGRFPNAVHACLGRLEEEIAVVAPRVILALGGPALAALTGAERTYTRREPFDCDHSWCGKDYNTGERPLNKKEERVIDRKVGPAMQCAACGWWRFTNVDGELVPEDSEDNIGAFLRDKSCPQCSATMKRFRPKRIKCPSCAGKKLREVDRVAFEYDYKIGEVAGAVIDGHKAGWSLMGVEYIIATYHPSFVLRPDKSQGSGEKKVMAGQFAAKAVQRHIRKAAYLLDHDRPWEFEFEVTSAHDDMDARDHVREYFDGFTELNYSTDIETEAWGTHYRCDDCGKRSGIELPEPAHTAQPLMGALCKGCGQRTSQTPEKGEMDARILEHVTSINCLGFANRRRGFALVVDTRRIQDGFMPNLKAELTERLEDHKLKKTYHHGTYDIPVLEKLWGIVHDGYADDTLIMHHVLCPDESHNLAHLAFRYTYARIWKPPKSLKGHEAHETFDALAQYNARDVMLTDEVREVMDSELDRKGNARAVYDLDMSLQHQALDMQRNGLPLNMEKAKKVGAEALQRRDAALEGLRKLLRDPEFNPQSPPQLRDALFNKLGYAVQKWTDGGKSGKKQASTAFDVLIKLPDSPFKRELLSFRAGADICKSYFDVSRGYAVPSRGLKLWGDGRIHFTWKPFGTRTGRFTSNPNAQNWPKWLRAMVEAGPGRVLVGADYDQLELRLIAALCGDENLIERCLTADDQRKLEPECDPHSYVANMAFGEAYTSLALDYPKHDKANEKCKCETCERKGLRELCKRVIYGLNYGAGDAKVLESIYSGGYNGPPLSIEMIGRVRVTIFRAFKGIPIWRDEQVRIAAVARAIFSPLLKRWRTFPLNDIPVTEIYNYPIQSGGADIVNLRTTKFYEEVAFEVDPTALYIAQMHDAAYWEVDEDRAQDFAVALGETLTWKTALYPGGPVMPFTASAAISKTWDRAS